MSEQMNHSAADIIQQALVDLGLATHPEDDGDWPAFIRVLPDKANTGNVICIYNQAGSIQGITVDLELQEHEGFQIAIRSDTIDDGSSKGRSLLRAIIRETHNLEVIVDGSTYRIHGVTPTSDLLDAGLENPVTRRRLFTINAIVSITMTSGPGTGSGSGT